MKAKWTMLVGMSLMLSLSLLCAQPGNSPVKPGPAATSDIRPVTLIFPIYANGIPATAESEGIVDAEPSQEPSAVGFKSRLTLTNLDLKRPARGYVEIRDPDGIPQDAELNGQSTLGGLDFEIPPGGTKVFLSRGRGRFRIGSAVVRSNRQLLGGLVIDGPDTSLGLGDSIPLRGFVMSLDYAGAGRPIRNALVLMNLGMRAEEVALELVSPDGTVLATAMVEVPGLGMVVKMVRHLGWDPSADAVDSALRLASLRGRVSDRGRIAVVGVGADPDEMWPLPVVKTR